MNEEIDFKGYIILLRNKNFIIFFTFLSFVLSTFYAIRRTYMEREISGSFRHKA